jgi:hypothetical protein
MSELNDSTVSPLTDTPDEPTELNDLVDEAEWDWLIPHAKRDAVVIVDNGLDLVEVGEAIAADNVPIVQRWIEEGQLIKPSPQQLSDWDGDRSKRFRALIVQPFVLVQPKAA